MVEVYKTRKEGHDMLRRMKGRSLLWAIDLALCLIVVGWAMHQGWTVTSCQEVDPSCGVYPAGCGFWCTTGSHPPVAAYECCCGFTANCPFPSNACCEAYCELYDCYDFFGNPCPDPKYPWDVYFVGAGFLWCPSGCMQFPYPPMAGICR